MKKINLFFLILVSIIFFSACVTTTVTPDGQTIVRKIGATGTEIAFTNGVANTCMEPLVIGSVYRGYDYVSYTPVCTGQTSQFFFSDSAARLFSGRGREITVTWKFFDAASKNYLGVSQEYRYRLRENGRHESEYELVDRVRQPKTLR